VLIKIVLNTENDQSLLSKYGVRTNPTNSKLIDDVFKAKPSNKNIVKLLSIDIFRILWTGEKGGNLCAFKHN